MVPGRCSVRAGAWPATCRAACWAAEAASADSSLSGVDPASGKKHGKWQNSFQTERNSNNSAQKLENWQ